MRQPRINTSQVQYILSHKIFFEEFTPNKSYNKSIIIRHDDSLYLSKYEIAEKLTFDPNDWIKFSNAADLESLIQEEKERAIAVEISLRNDLDAEIIRASQAESDLDESKLNKILEANKIYATNNNNEQISIGYSSNNVANTIVQRDNSGQINTALTPISNSNATSKKYVDDRIDAAISEAVVFKGIVESETELPSSGNTNGDMYWIKAFSDNPPAGMHPGHSGAAIYNGELEEFQFTEDAIYQPDNNTIELNSNGQLKVMVSVENNNSIEIKNDGLFVDISEKLDKIHSASKVYVTDNNGNQSNIGYDISNTVNTIAQRDVNGQLNVNLTPTSNSNAASKKYVDDADSSLNTNKQNRPNNAIENNIAVFNGNKDTIDSGKSFITSINDSETASNTKIPTELAVRTELDTKVDKIDSASKVYVTDNNGNQSNIGYDISNTANTIVERDNNSQINIAQTPTSDSHATSKKYVDDKVLDLDDSKQDRPDNAIENNIAIFNGNKDTIDSGKSFTTSISSNASDNKIPTELAVKNELDNKVDKIDSANQVYITSNSEEQSSISYDTANTANTIVRRDNNGQINVNLTPTANTNASSKKYVDDKVSNLDNSKQNRPNSAVENNIAIFNNNKDTIDSGKEFTTSINAEASDNKIPTELAVKNELDNKRDKVTSVSKVYVTDSNGNQSSISYDTVNTASTIVQRDNNSQINVALNPTANSHATSKKYVDDKIDSVISEAVVFKGIVANETLLPASGNNNGDMYWITAYSDNPPAGMTPGVSGSAIYKKPAGEAGEWNYTQDSIYQPDNKSIELDTNGQLTVKISETTNNSLVENNDGLYVDISGKLDKNSSITGATKTKITYDSKGLVTGGSNLEASDIPNLSLSKITDVTASASELNILDGATLTTTELNYVDGVTSNIQTQLDDKRDKITSASKVYTTDGTGAQSSISYTTSDTASTIVQRDANKQINIAQTPTANSHAASKKYVDTEVGKKVTANSAITGATKTKITYDSKGLVTAGADLVASDIPNLSLSKITDVTATSTEVNVLDGITASTTELNYVDGVTSNIQTQLNSKQATLVSGTNIKTINNNSILGSGNLDIDGLPSQTGQSGKFLTTNGTIASWGEIPSGTGGEFATYGTTTKAQLQEWYDDGKMIYCIYLNQIHALVANTSSAFIFAAVLPNEKIRYVNCSGDNSTWSNVERQIFIQCDIMPTATITNVNRIIQYSGATTSSYTKGYCYICKAQGTEPETYAWEQINIQPGGGATDDITIETNSEDKLQAIGTINKNTETDATNPIYDWVGTLAEYQIQQVKTLHPDWLCYITDDLDASESASNIDNSTIVLNDEDKIQAVAVVNSNNESGATNPIYDWVGTLQEYYDNNIATIHPEYICYITDDISGGYDVYTKDEIDVKLGEKVPYNYVYSKTESNTNFVAKGHEVIEFQAPTADNNYTWYRLYADGWVEQGGTSSFVASTGTITLPVTMLNAEYNVNLQLYASSDSGYAIAVTSRTVSSFSVAHQFTH